MRLETLALKRNARKSARLPVRVGAAGGVLKATKLYRLADALKLVRTQRIGSVLAACASRTDCMENEDGHVALPAGCRVSEQWSPCCRPLTTSPHRMV
jgi:hypothetical protein